MRGRPGCRHSIMLDGRRRRPSVFTLRGCGTALPANLYCCRAGAGGGRVRAFAPQEPASFFRICVKFSQALADPDHANFSTGLDARGVQRAGSLLPLVPFTMTRAREGIISRSLAWSVVK